MLGGSEGMPPKKILKIRYSEIAYGGHFGKENSITCTYPFQTNSNKVHLATIIQLQLAVADLTISVILFRIPFTVASEKDLHS